jgi:hypothetical protein
MRKLDYERKPVGSLQSQNQLGDLKWPIWCLYIGGGILFLASLVWGGIGMGCVYVFSILLGATLVKAIGDIVAGFIAAFFVKTELGTIGRACVKLAAVSVLCTALSAPFRFAGISMLVTAPVRWVLLMFFLEIEMVDSIIFCIASGIVLFVVQMFLTISIPH